MTCSELGKEYFKAVYYHSAYLTYMQNVVLDESQAEIKIARRNISDPQVRWWYHSNGKKWRRTEKLLDDGERGKWKVDLKLNIKKN